ncbi:MAG: hypothetical protein JJT90_10010 [Ectothiorhodospiraceae bacterium]|nr:hypothetical protein [Ectothiorhodospiraceae bacterium]
MTANTPTQTAEGQTRKKQGLRLFDRSEMPFTVYAAIGVTMALLWIFQAIHPDLTLGLFTELLGAAFTLFIIDTLLVRSKTKRWKVVREHMDYLIARNVNRLRDGLSVRAFGFEADIPASMSRPQQLAAIRAQRAKLLHAVETDDTEHLIPRLAEASLFSDNTYAYLNEKAEDLWDILNMKYSEYMDPELVSSLMRLHTHLKDVCAHLRQYQKAQQFPANAAYYEQIGRLGASVSLREIVSITNALKRDGYSEPASVTPHGDADPQPA